MHVGENISLLRKNKGMSQEMLAGRCQVSLRTIQRIESGSAQPRPYTLKMIADALDTTMVQLTPLSAEPHADVVNDLRKLSLINLSALLVVIVPLSNIILPFILWRKNQLAIPLRQSAVRIISFQILWTLATLLLLACTAMFIIPAMGAAVIGHFPPLILIVYGSMLIVNLVSIIAAAIRLQHGEISVYSFVPVLF